MIIELTDQASIRTEKRVRRHGYEYDFVFEHYINSKSAPGLGILLKSHKTGRYTWFNRNTIHMPFYDGNLLPCIIEGVKTYTENIELVHEYFDHLMANVLSKRDKKRFGPIYERARDGQPDLFERINNS